MKHISEYLAEALKNILAQQVLGKVKAAGGVKKK